MTDLNNERLRIGRKIAELRKEKGLSQVALAEKVNLKPSYIARIELGQHSTGIDLLSRIAEALGARIEFVAD